MLATASTHDINDGYVELSAQIRDAGLLDRRVGYYAVKGVLSVAVLGAAWAGLFLLGNSWTALAIAAALGIIFTQIVFFGHDAGHHQIFNDPRGNQTIGLVAGNLLTGLSFGWWVPKHGAHHAHPNQIDRDPDIGPGAVAFTAEAAAGRRHRISRLAARKQAWTFFPLLTLEGLGLHVASIQHLLHRKTRTARIESALIAAHTVAYLTVIFAVLSPLKAVAFIVIHQAVFGLYMGCSFAPNHKGMPTIDADARPSFAERQVLTARNVTGGPRHHLPARRSQLPDRAPPLPPDAPPQPGPIPALHPGLLRQPRPGLPPGQHHRLLPGRAPPPAQHWHRRQ